jgi:signal transduction histidine kinase/CheY-like chemotaxis protein
MQWTMSEIIAWLIAGGASGLAATLYLRGKAERVVFKRRLDELRLEADAAVSKRKELEVETLEATRALDVRTRFLANLSHEIRTPLNGVLGMTSVLLETELNREQLDITQTIAKSGESLMVVLNEILDFSKLEANAIQIEIFPFDPRECVEDVLDLFAGLAFDKKLDIASRFAADLPNRVLGDMIRVRQILSNLVSNAVKFTDSGEVIIDVEMDGDVMVFAVSDTGIGLSEAAMENLFVPFRQLGQTNQPGTGLGLVICKRLAELMDGEIRVESTPKLGSVFEVRIPVTVSATSSSDLIWERPGIRVAIVGPEITSRDVLGDRIRGWDMVAQIHSSCSEVDVDNVDVVLVFSESLDATAALLPHDLPKIFVSWIAYVSGHEKADALGTKTVLDRPVRLRALRQALRSALDGDTVTTTRRSLSKFEEMAEDAPRRILVAEDNATNQRVAKVMLERLGYTPVIVENGALAVEAARNATFDVIFMDIHMPVMDGIEATLQIRDLLPKDAQPWIVALTAGVNAEIRQAAEDAGMNDYITKPFTVESLRAAIENSQQIPKSPKSKGSAPLAQLKMLYETTPDEFVLLVDGHIGNVDLLMSDMEGAVKTKDLQRLALAAHSLKASLRMFGEELMGETADSIEVLAEEGDLEAAQRHLGLLKARWPDALKALEIERDTFGGG